MVTLAWVGGTPDAALVAAAEMRAKAEALRDPFQLCTAFTMTGLAHAWRREPALARDAARRALDVGSDDGSPVWLGRAMSIHHWAVSVLDPGAAKALSDELSTALALQLGAGPGGRTAFTPFVVGVYTAAGDQDRARAELDEALAFVERTDERIWSSELHRLRGDLVHADDKAEAERAFTRALEIARAQGATSFELRAALSLAKHKKNRAALDELRRSYGSFTEGFATGDLVEAKALLLENARLTEV